VSEAQRSRPAALRSSPVACPCGEAEVHDPDTPAAIEHDVRGLQIAVQHAVRVRGGQSRTDLPGDVERLLEWHSADALTDRGQCLPVHVLHRQVLPALDLADIEHAADVGVGDAACEPHFAHEPAAGVVAARRPWRHQLERDRLAQPEILGAVHFPHRAASQQTDDAEPGGEETPGDETRAVHSTCLALWDLLEG
jgi:hypothetical protein